METVADFILGGFKITADGDCSHEIKRRLFNLYAEYIMQNAQLDEAQAGIRIAGRNINNPDMQMTPPLWQKVKN